MGRPKVRVVIDPAFERKFLRTEPIRALLEPLVETMAQHARSSAAYRKGILRGGISTDVLIDTGARDAGGRFASGGGYVGRVTSHDFKTVWLEYGTRHMRAEPFLVPALIATVPGAMITRR